MTLDDTTRARIESLIASDRVVLFMKGTREQPMCGFSAATVDCLDALIDHYTTVNVLEDPEIREGIKRYSEWPTIPQLYIGGEFVGGCDIVKEMFNTGALHETLGLPAPDRTPPDIELSDAAAELVRAALEDNPGMAVHLSIDARGEHALRLGPAEGHEVEATSNGITVLMDVATAARARGLRIDCSEGFAGQQIEFRNPNLAA